MAGEAYDHLLALVVLGVMFGAAVVVVPSLSYVNLLYLDQQQLRNVALSALKTIVFDEGYPANWGSMHGLSQFDASDVKRFGLALLSDPSLYVLDPNKVQRLSFNPMGNLSYSKVRELLGLTGYDFSIVLRPQFNVEKSVKIGSDKKTVSFNVNVSRYGGQPLPNAIVSATMFYTMKGPGQDDFDTRIMNMENKYTDSLGRCNGAVSIPVAPGWEIKDVAVIFKVTVADRTTIVVSEQSTPNPTDVAKVSLVGDYIIATIDEALPGSKDARWIVNIMMYNSEGSVNLYNATAPPWGEPDLQKGLRSIWSYIFPSLSYSEPSILVFTIRTDIEGPGGRTFVLLIGPYTMWTQGGVIDLNPAPVSSGASVSVQRDVIIAGMAYILELRLWKTT